VDDRYRFRTPTLDDAPAIGDLFVAERRADPLAPVLDTGFVLEVWTRTGFDLATDAWAVTDPSGALVGYGQVRFEEEDAIGSWGLVHPDHRGRGIGAALLDRIEARAVELAAGRAGVRFRHAVNAGDPAAADLVRARGLAPVHHFWHMQVDLDPHTATPAPIPPAPITIEGLDARGDLAAVHAILAEAFAEDWADIPGPLDRFVAEETASPTYDPSLWFLAWDGDTPVGTAAGGADGEAASIDWFGVARSHRGRGIGAALLRHAFAAFAARGVTQVRVSVDADNLTGATGVYERAGMRVVGRWDLWERALRGGRPGAPGTPATFPGPP
jgi:mycothiol synthase